MEQVYSGINVSHFFKNEIFLFMVFKLWCCVLFFHLIELIYCDVFKILWTVSVSYLVSPFYFFFIICWKQSIFITKLMNRILFKNDNSLFNECRQCRWFWIKLMHAQNIFLIIFSLSYLQCNGGPCWLKICILTITNEPNHQRFVFLRFWNSPRLWHAPLWQGARGGCDRLAEDA